MRRWLHFNFSDTYFMEIYRGDAKDNVKVYESEWFVNDLNHRFEPIKITDAHLCGCDPKAPITIKFINRNQFTMTNTEVATLETSVLQLASICGKSIICDSKVANTSNTVLKVHKLKEMPIPEFSHFLREGYEVCLMGAIDFTYSNGCSSSPQSLHYTGNNNGENQYTEVLRAVTTILDHYDSDKEYPFYGFGAQVAGYTQVSHCFPLNGDPKSPSIRGVDAVIEAYKEILPNLRMSGPTNFAPLLRECKRQIQSQ